MPSEKNFGLVFFGFFCILGGWLYFDSNIIAVWPFLTAGVTLLLSFGAPKLIRPANIIWYLLGQGLGRIMSPIVLLILFVFIILPTGLLMRLFKGDFLNLKVEKSKQSYWILRDSNSSTSMKDQF